jgi:hypothetical protein
VLHSDTCIVFDAHAENDVSLENFRVLKYAASELCAFVQVLHSNDKPAYNLDETITLSDKEIFNDTVHFKDVLRGVVPGNSDLKIVQTAKKLPKYSYFVRMEWDVVCTTDPRRTLSKLVDFARSCDFSGSFVKKFPEDPEWDWWSSLHVPGWPTSELRDVAHSAFLPLMTFSKRYITRYEELLSTGWTGHFETTMATAAHVLGMKIKDLSTGPSHFTSLPGFSCDEVIVDGQNLPPFVHTAKRIETFRRLQSA